jgi:hypothetical protein
MVNRKELLNDALKCANTNLNIEGQYLSDHGKDLIRRYFNGEMTHPEFIKHALRIAKGEE